MKKTLTSIVSVLTLVVFFTSCAPAQTSTGDTKLRTINVSGTGTVNLEPDIAMVNIGVHSQFPELAEALEENSASAQAVIKSLMDKGIEARDIQTRNFNIYPQQDTRPGPEEGPEKTFVVENTIAVVVRELDLLGEVLATVVADGANTIYGITFDIEDRETAVEEARLLAIEDAQTQAETIAEAAGIDLGAILSINFDRNGVPLTKAEFAMDQAQSESVPISGGTLNIQVTAYFTYEIN